MSDSPREAYLKPVDAPIETLILDPITSPVAKLAARFASPLAITAVAFAARIAAVPLFAVHELTWGALCALVGFVLDSTDGKVARLRGQTVHVHETVDFVVDQVAFSAMAVGLLAGELGHGSDATAVAIAIFMAAYTVLLSLGGTRFRLLGELGIDWRRPAAVSGVLEESDSPQRPAGGLRRMHRRYAAIQKGAARHRLLARPTAIEGLVLIFIIAPLLGTPLWCVILAAAILLPDLLVNAVSVVVLARAQDR
jgi:phosphatidylglycerophosphate synthase